MSAIHILDGDGVHYRAVIHKTTPAGTNLVGNSWKACLMATGKNTSCLPTGTGLGQITSAELASITAGDVIEIVTSIAVRSTAQSAAQITALINGIVADELRRLEDELAFYGYTL